MTALTHSARVLLAQPDRAELQKTYAELRFLQFGDFVAGDTLAALVRDLLPAVLPHAARIVRPHEIDVGLLRGGRRFWRIDPGAFEGGANSAEGAAAIAAAFERSGLAGFVREVVEATQPFVEEVVGHRLRYDRTFLLAYDEADFIAPHGDTQTSRRIMLQMPVPFACQTAMRVLRDGWMEPYYDHLGAFRVHGPGIWHEVLPVLRADPQRDPVRVLVTARLPYADDA